MPIGASLLAWLLILALAVANGALREAVLVPAVGKAGGFAASGVLLSVLVALVAWFLVRRRRSLTVIQGLFMGAFWLCLTLAFEFGFGRYVQHQSWEALIKAYTFEDGNIWPVVLLVTFLAPAIAVQLRAGLKPDRPDN